MNLSQAIQATETLMFEAVASDVEILEEASRYILQAGGKRVRPRVFLLAYLAAGGRALEEVLPLAAAVELVHTATLVHDDINDHSSMRRGHETINARWGRTIALLTGDFLFTKVYQLVAPYGDLNALFAEATVALVEGEALQAASARAGTLNRETYQQIIAKKTASLFRLAAMLGAKAANAAMDQIEALGAYGFYLGLVFQIVDDLLDLVGDPALMGKAAGVDLKQGKGVSIAVAQSGNGHDREAAVAAGTATSDPFVEIKRRLVADGAVEEGRHMAQVLAQQARAELDKLPPGPGVDGLRELITLVLQRDR